MKVAWTTDSDRQAPGCAAEEAKRKLGGLKATWDLAPEIDHEDSERGSLFRSCPCEPFVREEGGRRGRESKLVTDRELKGQGSKTNADQLTIS